VRLGYTNIRRMPHGYFGWKAYISPDSDTTEEKSALALGDYFPTCRLMLLDYQKDRDYLQISHVERNFTLEDVQSDYLFIEIYNELCSACVNEVETYKALYRMLLADAFLGGKVKMMGIGAGSKKRSAAKFRKQKKISFPLFADEKREIFECLGKPVLPVSYLVQRQSGKRKIRLIQSGHIGRAEKLLTEIKAAVAGDWGSKD
jgi:peroxiredoxin